MNDSAARPHARRHLWQVIFPILPVLNLGYQYCAEKLAQSTTGLPIDVAWFGVIVAQPWVVGLVVFEIGSFAAWMVILSQAPLSVVFPLTAVSYALAVTLGWLAFREPIEPLQIASACVIFAGIYLLGSDVKDGAQA